MKWSNVTKVIDISNTLYIFVCLLIAVVVVYNLWLHVAFFKIYTMFHY